MVENIGRFAPSGHPARGPKAMVLATADTAGLTHFVVSKDFYILHMYIGNKLLCQLILTPL
jgi:hypothetical protein